jgi:hypothetical protein
MGYLIEVSRKAAKEAVRRKAASLDVVSDEGWKSVEDEGDAWGTSHMEWFPREEDLVVEDDKGHGVRFRATGNGPFSVHCSYGGSLGAEARFILDNAGIEYSVV